ncbi:MAG TPA: ABC transporter permease [Candidatus Sulfomarinibacteraceae bacterium]|nr:ABC transporter permease [Candidatus Sulfomarinibacteraceae bacterium]
MTNGQDPQPASPGGSGGSAVTAAVLPRGKGISVPETAALVLVLIGLFAYFSVTSKFFLNPENLVNILQNVAVVGIIACPATLLLIAGQFDLSVGSSAGFVAMLMAVAALVPGSGGTEVPWSGDLPLMGAFVVAVLGTLLIGAINAFSVTVIGINALITTLGTLAVFRGLTKVLGNGQTIRINDFGQLGVQRILGIPLPVYIFAAAVILFWFVLRYTVYGRSLYAIGASPTAARLAGIRTKRVIFIAFLLSSACVALAGLIRLSQVGGASVNGGLGLELSVVTAVVLGGASLSGGRGGIPGTVLAVLIVGVLANGLIQLNVPSFWIEVANGLLLLGAVTVDRVRVRFTRADN